MQCQFVLLMLTRGVSILDNYFHGNALGIDGVSFPYRKTSKFRCTSRLLPYHRRFTQCPCNPAGLRDRPRLNLHPRPTGNLEKLLQSLLTQRNMMRHET